MRLLLVLAFVLAAGSLVWWMTQRSLGQARGALEARRAQLESAAPLVERVPAPPDAAELRVLTLRILETLERIESRLQLAGERESLAPSMPQVSSGAEQGLLRELQASVELLLERSEDPSFRLQRLREERPEADWAALGALLALWETDVEQARKEVQLLSEAEVLRRYGSPDLTFPDGSGARWIYGRRFVPSRDAYELQLTFVFREGLVRSFFVEHL
jgi:hypothetical protein